MGRLPSEETKMKISNSLPACLPAFARQAGREDL